MPRYYFYPRSPCGERPNLLISEASANIFLSTLSLRRATATCTIWAYTNKFLSTLSLRRATVTAHTWQGGTTDFYPRSPCGERLFEPKHEHHNFRYFYPRSPCGERRGTLPRRCRSGLISIHALLAESDSIRLAGAASPPNISIHALLAESDQLYINRTAKTVVFLSTLSLRRATNVRITHNPGPGYFYPRSPCGERPICADHHKRRLRFLSTLSLRRATHIVGGAGNNAIHFYPRSPCGERHCDTLSALAPEEFLSTLSLRRATNARPETHQPYAISIHALLAESDQKARPNCQSK